MIVLDVENYCHECPVFEADVHSYLLHNNGMPVETRHDISCKHRYQCRTIKNHLEKENKKCVD